MKKRPRTEALVRMLHTPYSDRTYVERFEEMAAELKAHPQITLERFEIKPPIHPEEVEKFHQIQPMSKEMRQFYSECNGINIEWKSSEPRVTGAIDILQLKEIYASYEDYLWSYEWDECVIHIHPFDFFVEEGRGCLHFDGSTDPPMYLHTQYPEALEVTVGQYLELLFRTRGWWYWQSAIVADLNGKDNHEARNFRWHMPELFPDYDEVFFFRHRYQQADAEERAARKQRSEEFCTVLDKYEVRYHFKDDGSTYHITVPNEVQEVQKAVLALQECGWDFDYATGMDWGARFIRGVCLEKDQLHEYF